MAYISLPGCGCWVPVKNQWGGAQKQYLPQLDLRSHTTILATTSRTVLKQTFVAGPKLLEETQYTFPLYDGVSVVGFKCTVAGKILEGVVKEKQQARRDYNEAIERGETAGLLEQIPEASDVFTTKIGNVPAREKIFIEIVYLGELKHDAETDGSRFTIPTIIAPRYGSTSHESSQTLNTVSADDRGGIEFFVDISLDNGSIIRGLQSPSHPIAVTMGRTSSMAENVFENNHASASLTLGSAELDKDFVVVILSKEQGVPRALLETHPTIPNQRALMTTLVPKFNIPNISPEIVFIVDRSGSMDGKIRTLVSALKIFLKSLPVNGVKFNICSFGSSHSFLFKKSKTYDQSSLDEALRHVSGFAADFGGTEMFPPVQNTCKNRYKDMPLEVMVLTDGQIWNQQEMFDFINKQKNARFFSLGIGAGASSALVEGIARAGHGFAQFVADNEKMDKRVVRMLKGALTPHIDDYTLTVQYEDSHDEDFEMVEASPSQKPVEPVESSTAKPGAVTRLQKKAISLFNTDTKEEPINNPGASRFDNLPTVASPRVLQAPNRVPPLFAFNRTTVYLLLGAESPQKTPKAVFLRGTSEHGPLELEIAVQDVGQGQTIHQLAAKKAVHELEQGRGWITDVKSEGKPLKVMHEGRWDLIVERECVRLGVQFQVAGKYCSFVAIEKKADGEKVDDFEIVAKRNKPTTSQECHAAYGVAPGAGTASGYSGTSSSSPLGRGGASRTRSTRGLFSKSATDRAAFGGSFLGSAAPSSPAPAYPQHVAALGAPVQRMMQQQQQSPPPMARRSVAPVPLSVPPHQSPIASNAQQVAGYQQGLMALEQQNKKRLSLTRDPAGQSQPDETAERHGLSAPVGSFFRARSMGLAKQKARHSTGGKAPRMQLASKSARKDAPLAEGADDEIDEEEDDDLGVADSSPKRAKTPSRTLTDEEKMHQMIDLQKFDGSWSGSEKLWSLLGLNVGETSDVGKGEDTAVRATALAVAWLKVKMGKEEDVWEMVVDKAKAWLVSALGEDKAGGVVDEAEKLVSI